ncbi:hypothetical protein GOBAR_AA01640 [Gossypium barbadense]|uniref:Uncharacterized protein n=1 Tax=Gossypium barbadense TaxID=3634 RepID=A0A2P5YTM2_GOSBA|nr:hypothetical protein GOBAR_AA01640 [Gossypium barbadense]
MLDFWVKFKEIDLYVEHEVDNLIIINENFLLTTGEGDDEGVEPDGEGDLKKVESGREGDVGEVQADGEGVSIGMEVDKDIGMESGGHISLGSIVGKDNDSEVVAHEYASDFAVSDGVNNIANEYASDFATLDGVDKITDEYAGDFATSDGLDNVVATCSGEEEDRNETEVWYSYESGSLVRSDKDEEHKDAKKIVMEKMVGNNKEEFGLLWDYAHELRSKMLGSTIKMVVQKGLEIAISNILPRVEHRNCVRHMLENWPGRKLRKSYECDFWLHDWEKIGIEPVLSPIERKMPGRPKKNRRMTKNEPKKLKPSHLVGKQDTQPLKQKGKSSIKKSTTLDKSKGKQTFYSGRTTRSMTIASCQDGSGQTSSTTKSRNNK